VKLDVIRKLRRRMIRKRNLFAREERMESTDPLNHHRVRLSERVRTYDVFLDSLDKILATARAEWEGRRKKKPATQEGT
jgi:hypothetical protein